MEQDLFLTTGQLLDTTSIADLIGKRANYINIDVREYLIQDGQVCIIDNSTSNSCFDIHEGDNNGYGFIPN